MIVEQRTYTLKPGSIPEYIRLYQNEGKAIQREHLKNMVGYYFTEIGPLNQVIHMWQYESFEDRLQRRGKLIADPRWDPYVRKIHALVVAQETKLLNVMPWFRPQVGLLDD